MKHASILLPRGVVRLTLVATLTLPAAAQQFDCVVAQLPSRPPCLEHVGNPVVLQVLVERFRIE